MRFGFVTCVSLGLACMEQIARMGGHLDLVITLRDDLATAKSGRVWLDDFCERHGNPLVKVGSVNDPESVEAIKAHSVDWLFIIGWSQIARPPVLEAPRKGVLGMHPTLLPVGRGRAPIPWAILKGLDETGVTLFQLDEGVDTGPIVAQERLPIRPDETATTLYERVQQAHQSLLAKVWDDLVNDGIELTTQDESRATVWPGRTPADGEISADMALEEVDRLVRATTRPYPGAFFDHPAGFRLHIWAGRPWPSDGSGSGPVIKLSDGTYEAVDYSVGEQA